MKIWRTALALLVGWLPGAPALAVTGEPVRRALLIGIDDYRSPQVRDLLGAVNDTYVMENLLRTRWAFDEVRTLRDRQATRTGILDALRRLARDSGPEDVAWIHFSGHGSQVADRNGDEADGRDETLIPWDGRTDGVADILDDELAVILQQFRTQDLIVVFDSCHSGTATRNPDRHVTRRFAVMDRRVGVYESLDVPAAAIAEQDLPCVFFSGADADQPALGGSTDGGYFGLFSRALAAALSRGPRQQSAREILHSAAQEYRRLTALLGTVPSTPRLEGPAARLDAPLLRDPGPSGTRIPWFPVAGEPARPSLLGGTRVGAAPGSLWALHRDGDRQFTPEQRLALARVGGDVGADAWLELDRPLEGTGPWRAVPVAPPRSDGLPVRFRRGEALRDEVVRWPGIDVVGDQDLARLIVTQVRTRYRVEAPGEPVPLLEEADAEGVRAVLTRTALAQAFLALDNPSAQLCLDVAAAGQDREHTGRVGERNIFVLANDARDKALRFCRGRDDLSEETCLLLRVRASERCYLTVVAVGTDGSIQRLFPHPEYPDFLPDGQVEGDTEVCVPDAIGLDNRAGFQFAYAPPAGRNTVRVFAMRDLDTATRLREALDELQVTSREPPSLERQLDRIANLRQALSGVRTRGFVAAEVPAPPPARPPSAQITTEAASADWTAVSINLVVGGDP